MDQAKKCKHAGCTCVPSGKEDYCSVWCKDAKSVTEITCQCRHAVCSGEKLKA